MTIQHEAFREQFLKQKLEKEGLISENEPT